MFGPADQQTWTAVDEYVSELLAPDDEALERAVSGAVAAGLPAIQVSPPQGKLLHLLQREADVFHAGERPNYELMLDIISYLRDFTDRFGNPDFPNPFDPHRQQVHFLGVWDTVKTIGWLNWQP